MWYRETASPDLLDRAQTEIRRIFAAQEGFVPTNLFIATWDHVGYYDFQVDKVYITAKIRSCFNLGVVISVSYSDEITVARSHVHTLAQHSLHTTT